MRLRLRLEVEEPGNGFPYHAGKCYTLPLIEYNAPSGGVKNAAHGLAQALFVILQNTNDGKRYIDEWKEGYNGLELKG